MFLFSSAMDTSEFFLSCNGRIRPQIASVLVNTPDVGIDDLLQEYVWLVSGPSVFQFLLSILRLFFHLYMLHRIRAAHRPLPRSLLQSRVNYADQLAFFIGQCLFADV